MKLFCAGDLHLAAGAWKTMPKVHGDAFRSWDQIVDDACREKPDWVILAGDVFDSRTPPPDAIYVFRRGCMRLSKEKVPVAFIEGQHERSSARDPDDGTSLPWCRAIWRDSTRLEAPFIRKFKWSKLKGTKLAGCSNCEPEEMKLRLADLPADVEILVLHQLTRGSVGSGNWDLDPEWVPKTVKLVLLGDVHAPWEYVNANGTRFIYSGSTCMQDLSETPDKSYLEVDTETFEVKRRKLNTRPFVEIRIDTPEQLDAEAMKLAGLPDHTLAVVRYDRSVVAVEKVCRNTAPKELNIMFRQIPPPEVVETNLDFVGDCLVSCLEEMVDKGKDPARFDLEMCALRADTAKEAELAIDEWVRRNMDSLDPMLKEPF